jgi:MFS family permease
MKIGGPRYSGASTSEATEELKQSLTGRKKQSYIPVIIAYTFYAITYTIVIPALPALTLNLCHGKSTHSSYLLGLANFARYISEFFAAPLLGTGTDLIGRKPMLFGSIAICGIEYAILSFFPSIEMLFATRIMAGLFDCSNPTVYTIITDLAIYNGDNVTTQFGLITALLGIGFVIGPLLGGILCDISISFCFLISAIISGIGAAATLFFLEETLPLATMDSHTNDFVVSVAGSEFLANEIDQQHSEVSDWINSSSQLPNSTPSFLRNNTNTSALTMQSNTSVVNGRENSVDDSERPVFKRQEIKKWQDITFEDLNPIPALITHMKSPIMRDLTIPLFVSSLTVGTGSIWVIYQVHRYHSTSTEVGIYMSVYGVISAFILGVLIKYLIPNVWNEQQASIIGFILLGMQYMAYGVAPTYWSLFVIVAVLTIGMVSDPALKALIVKESLNLPDGVTVQGNLQGVLCSIRTLGTAFGSLIFASLFAVSLKLKPEAPYISFVLAGSFFIFCAIYLTFLFYWCPKGNESLLMDDGGRKESTGEDSSSVPSFASGKDFRTSESGWKAFLGSRNHSTGSSVPPPSPFQPLAANISNDNAAPIRMIFSHHKGNGVSSSSFSQPLHTSALSRPIQQDGRQISVGSRIDDSAMEEQHRGLTHQPLESIPAFHLLTGHEFHEEKREANHSIEETSNRVDTMVLLSSGMMGGYPAPVLLPMHSSHPNSRSSSRTISRC